MGKELVIVCAVDSVRVVYCDVELTSETSILVEETGAVVDTCGNVRGDFVSSQILEVDVANGKT